jgi:hypothetical protein
MIPLVKCPVVSSALYTVVHEANVVQSQVLGHQMRSHDPIWFAGGPEKSALSLFVAFAGSFQRRSVEEGMGNWMSSSGRHKGSLEALKRALHPCLVSLVIHRPLSYILSENVAYSLFVMKG